MTTRQRLFAAALVFSSTAALAAPQFPALTGRVVDEAGILSPQFESEISTQLAAHEQATTNQVVIVTLKSLDGYEISDYANRLFRHWGVGQKDKNNGVLLIVAPTERKMRIEVGYGLEGVLTDAISRDIIERRLKPAFRQQNYEQGIRNGVGAILAALGDKYQVAPPPVTDAEESKGYFFMAYVLFMVFVANAIANFSYSVNDFLARRSRQYPIRTRLLIASVFGGIFGTIAGFIFENVVVAIVVGIVLFVLALLSRRHRGSDGDHFGDGSGGGWSGGGGGGFSGGGGSSGGGGASGGW